MKISFFNLFKKKRKRRTKPARREKTSPSSKYAKFKSDLENIRSQITNINIILQKHDNDLDESSFVLKKHIKKFEKLEELIVNRPINQPAQRFKSVDQFAKSPNLGAHTKPHKFEISGFSHQERRILSAFFQNKDMSLSYVDIARFLGKSPHTVKNQMRQINMKADLFNFSVGNDNRKRYRLKDGLKIEKYFNIDRPATNPAIQSPSLDDPAAKID